MELFLTFILPLIIIFGILYFIVMKPEKKRQQQVYHMQAQIKKDDKIVTVGGIHGIVDNDKGDVLTIVVASGARMKVDRSAIKAIINDEE